MNAMTNRTFFNTDKTLESVTGISVVIGDWTFKTKRAGGSNLAFQARLTILRKPYERLLNEKPGANDDALSVRQQEIGQTILIEAAAEKLLLGWDGVINADLYDPLDDGSLTNGLAPEAAALFTKENVILLFTRYPDAFNEYYVEAAKLGNFRKKAVEEQAGNSVSA